MNSLTTAMSMLIMVMSKFTKAVSMLITATSTLATAVSMLIAVMTNNALIYISMHIMVTGVDWLVFDL